MPSESIRIQTVTSKQDLDAFITFPWRVQQDDPCWVPPIISQHRKILDPQHGPFYDFGQACLFMAYRGNEPVGRISAHVNFRHDELYHDDTGFWGFFECVDDQEVANALFEAAGAWLREKGRKRILGPLSFGIYDEVGILIKGFDTLPAMLQTHNPPYYQTLVENWGFTKIIDWFAMKIDRESMADTKPMKAQLDEIMKTHDLVLTSAKASDLIKRRNEVREIFNEAWSSNWGHVPFTEHQFKDILKELRPVLRPDLIRLILTKDDRVAAFIISIPDLNPVFKTLNGKLNIFGMLKLLYHARFKPITKIRTVLLGVRPEFQHHNLHHALILSSYVDFEQQNIQFCDCSLIPEQLRIYMRTLARYGAKKYKTWRLFERPL